MQSVVFFTKTVEPFDARFMAKPCQLAFGVMAYIQLGLFHCAGKVALALEILDDPPVTVGTECVRAR